MILTFLPASITDGSIYALCALGLVLTYKTSGVFNFAHGALAAGSAYVFYQFRVLNGMPWPLAALLSLVLVGILGGLILERLAQQLQSAPTVSVVIATVGLLVFIQGLATGYYGASQISFDEFLPTGGFRVGKALVSGGDIIIVVGTLGSAFALFYFFNHSRLGKAMNAVVDDPNLLSLQATNPATVRRAAWVLGSCFASVSGMLLAPKEGVSVDGLILLVIAAYGAAAIGFFDNLPLTVAGGIAIGFIVDYSPEALTHVKNQNILQLPGNAPFLVLFAALVFIPARKLTQRGVRNARRFRPVRSFPIHQMAPAMAIAAAGLIILPFVINKAKTEIYASSLGYFIIFASLALITWTSGQISLCQMGFAAVGATTLGHCLHAGVPYPLALLIAGLVTVPAGAIVAIPAIRLSGIYVAIATFGFGILLEQIFYPTFLMFGLLNNVETPRPHILGINFTSDRGFYFLALIVAGLMSVLVVAVLRSRLGSLLRALSDSPDALDAHGANTTLTRILVFCISAFMAGIGGAILAGGPQSASGSKGGPFDYTVSLIFIAVLGFCGRRPLISPLIAATLFEVIKVYAPFNGDFWKSYSGVFFGIAAILVAIGPSLNLPLLGRRASEREGPGAMSSRFLEEKKHVAIQPIRVQPATRVPERVRSGAARQPAGAGNGPRQPVGARSGLNGSGLNGGTRSKGASSNGVSSNGVSSNGVSSNGASSNGVSSNGVSSNGNVRSSRREARL